MLEQDGLWREDYTTSWYGRTFTLDIQRKIGPVYELDQLFFVLGWDLDFRIFIHDPAYFVVNTNPIGLPSLKFQISPNESKNHYYQITLTEMEEIDHPDDPCEVDPNYNYQACVKESVSKKVGCRLPWDTWTSKAFLKCRSLDQYRYLTCHLLFW